MRDSDSHGLTIDEYVLISISPFGGYLEIPIDISSALRLKLWRRADPGNWATEAAEDLQFVKDDQVHPLRYRKQQPLGWADVASATAQPSESVAEDYEH
jgi:hypothetical protein